MEKKIIGFYVTFITRLLKKIVTGIQLHQTLKGKKILHIQYKNTKKKKSELTNSTA